MPAPEDLQEFDCRDCGESTHDLDEYYMVHDHVWRAAGMTPDGGMLCIGCLENRLSRRLTEHDFPDYPVNFIFRQSHRLQNRIASTPAPAQTQSESLMPI